MRKEAEGEVAGDVNGRKPAKTVNSTRWRTLAVGIDHWRNDAVQRDVGPGSVHVGVVAIFYRRSHGSRRPGGNTINFRRPYAS